MNGLSFIAFVLWEIPSMVMLALHKLICALTGRSFAMEVRNIWAYRLVGMLVFWPVILVSCFLASLSD